MNNSEGFRLIRSVAEEQQDVLVPELEIPYEPRRVAVHSRKHRHLERLAGLHRGLGNTLTGQRRDGSGRQNPVHDLALDLLVRHRKHNIRVRIYKVQLLETSLEN